MKCKKGMNLSAVNCILFLPQNIDNCIPIYFAVDTSVFRSEYLNTNIIRSKRLAGCDPVVLFLP